LSAVCECVSRHPPGETTATRIDYRQVGS
jgi:hypothetical protein